MRKATKQRQNAVVLLLLVPFGLLLRCIGHAASPHRRFGGKSLAGETSARFPRLSRVEVDAAVVAVQHWVKAAAATTTATGTRTPYLPPRAPTPLDPHAAQQHARKHATRNRGHNHATPPRFFRATASTQELSQFPRPIGQFGGFGCGTVRQPPVASSAQGAGGRPCGARVAANPLWRGSNCGRASCVVRGAVERVRAGWRHVLPVPRRDLEDATRDALVCNEHWERVGSTARKWRRSMSEKPAFPAPGATVAARGSRMSPGG